MYVTYSVSNETQMQKGNTTFNITIISLMNLRQHTPQRAWDNGHSLAGGSNQVTGYSVQLFVVKHQRHCNRQTHVRYDSAEYNRMHE